MKGDIKLKKPRSCDGCRALLDNPNCSPTLKCELGFATYKPLAMSVGGSIDTITPPTTGCPKPRTLSELVDFKVNYGD